MLLVICCIVLISCNALISCNIFLHSFKELFYRSVTRDKLITFYKLFPPLRHSKKTSLKMDSWPNPKKCSLEKIGKCFRATHRGLILRYSGLIRVQNEFSVSIYIISHCHTFMLNSYFAFFLVDPFLACFFKAGKLLPVQ